MGLGLTIYKLIIQQLGGEVDVLSVPKSGSNFFFTLPLEESVDAPRGHLLIIEDRNFTNLN